MSVKIKSGENEVIIEKKNNTIALGIHVKSRDNIVVSRTNEGYLVAIKLTPRKAFSLGLTLLVNYSQILRTRRKKIKTTESVKELDEIFSELETKKTKTKAKTEETEEEEIETETEKESEELISAME